MNLDVLTHDGAVSALHRYAAGDARLTAVVGAITLVHTVERPEHGRRPDPDCIDCLGSGIAEYASLDDTVIRRHCCCRCPWCVGCDNPVCEGPCPTVIAVGAALGIPGLIDRVPVCAATQPTPAGTPPYRCSDRAGHHGAHRAVVDGQAVAEWPARP